MLAIGFDVRQHTVRETAFGSFMRERLKDPLIFTYRHARTGNWMLAAWLTHPFGRMIELAVLGRNPTGTPEIVKSVDSMKRSTQGDDERAASFKMAKSLEKTYVERELADAKEFNEHWKFLSRKRKGLGRDRNASRRKAGLPALVVH